MEQFKSFIRKAEEKPRPEKLLREEKNVLERFRGKASRLVSSFIFLSNLAFGMVQLATSNESFAFEKKEKNAIEQVEKEKNLKEIYINFLNKLYNLPDNPNAQNPGQNELLKKRAARMLIMNFAAMQKLGFPENNIQIDVRLEPEDIKKTIDGLNTESGFFADRFLGNNDGNVDPDEMQKLNQIINSNPGLKALREMIIQYSD
jgi:hypothetical protein